jgi:ERCC4-type nuclease
VRAILDEPLHLLEDQREPPRERHPWQWSGSVHVERAFLPTADYILRDHPKLIGLERKTLSDWLGVITGSRTRFVRELERLQDFEHRFVIVEDAGWFSLVSGRYRSRASASSVLGSAAAWMLRYRTHVIPAGDPPTAVAIAERLLRRAQADHLARGLPSNTPAGTESPTVPITAAPVGHRKKFDE